VSANELNNLLSVQLLLDR